MNTTQNNFVETFRGVVYPWHCDHQNHMTVMHYVGMFDAAFWHHVALFGFTPGYLKSENLGFADVKDILQYMAELPVGSLVVIRSGVIRVGGKSFTALHEMYDAENDTLAATSEKTSAFFNLTTRSSEPLPDHLKSEMESNLVVSDH